MDKFECEGSMTTQPQDGERVSVSPEQMQEIAAAIVPQKAMQPTSSASSADKSGADEYALTEYSADQWWFKELEGIVSRDRLTEDQYRGINIARQLIPRLLAALASQAIVPQVVQAPIDTELLASLKKALMNAEYAINGREHTGFITKAIKSIDDYVAAPIVATAIDKPLPDPFSILPEGVAFGDELTRLTLDQIILNARDYYAAPVSASNPNCKGIVDSCSPADEQASDVRDQFESYMTDECFSDLQELTYDENGEYDDADIQALWDAFRKGLKSATPEDKGNAPVEVDEKRKELRSRLGVASIVIGSLPEQPGYNGSILMIDDVEAREIEATLTDAIDYMDKEQS